MDTLCAPSPPAIPTLPLRQGGALLQRAGVKRFLQPGCARLLQSDQAQRRPLQVVDTYCPHVNQQDTVGTESLARRKERNGRRPRRTVLQGGHYLARCVIYPANCRSTCTPRKNRRPVCSMGTKPKCR